MGAGWVHLYPEGLGFWAGFLRVGDRARQSLVEPGEGNNSAFLRTLLLGSEYVARGLGVEWGEGER